tara:strand:+ start:58 stop:216 length:159 start_codon:yes stop_codon:yes gene_type:complete
LLERGPGYGPLFYYIKQKFKKKLAPHFILSVNNKEGELNLSNMNYTDLLIWS